MTPEKFCDKIIEVLNNKEWLIKFINERIDLEQNNKLSYKQYLQSPHWNEVRKLAIENAKGKCQLCNNNKYLNVHHRTYIHLGNEQNNLSDLTVLCKNCHEKFHSSTG